MKPILLCFLSLAVLASLPVQAQTLPSIPSAQKLKPVDATNSTDGDTTKSNQKTQSADKNSSKQNQTSKSGTPSLPAMGTGMPGMGGGMPGMGAPGMPGMGGGMPGLPK